MTLQESIQRLLEISNQKKELTKQIKENYLHTEENDMLYERWLNTRFEGVRQKIRQEIANGKKKWEEFLEFFPLPDKPFDINDVEDEEFKSCILEIERLEKELNSVENEIARASGKLSNKGFLDKAPKSLVDSERAKLNKYIDMREKLLAQIKDLKG